MDLRILGAVGVVVALFLIVVVPRRVAPKHLFESHAARLGVENEIRRTIIQMLGGSFVLVSVFFTYETVRISQESLALAERGQVTERFTRAIDQIGNERLDVAIGGIYALGQLAQESETEHEPVMDILATYVREHSPAPGFCGDDDPVAPDVQAAITVIGSRNAAFEDAGERLDLTMVNLERADFSGGNYDRVDFSGSCLFLADFDGATLLGADFSSVSDPNGGGARFTPTDLTAATFRDVRGAGSVFEGADMVGVVMTDADLAGANLRRVTLGDPQKIVVGLTSDLRGADLTGADLYRAELDATDLRGAVLKGADVDERELQAARIDDTTILP